MTPALRALVVLARRWLRAGPGDYLLDESGNYLTDESGNRLVG
jgi:hypothetical protein